MRQDVKVMEAVRLVGSAIEASLGASGRDVYETLESNPFIYKICEGESNFVTLEGYREDGYIYITVTEGSGKIKDDVAQMLHLFDETLDILSEE